jgi:hypothetical protein
MRPNSLSVRAFLIASVLSAATLSTPINALLPPPLAMSFGFIDRTGNDVVPPACDRITQPNWDGWTSLARDGHEGFFNLRTGKGTGLIFDVGDFHETPLFEEGLEPVRRGVLYGYTDHVGQTRLPFAYEAAHQFRFGLAAVKLNGKFGFIDKSGRFVIRPIFDIAGTFDENGLAIVSIDHAAGMIDRSGHVVVPLRYDAVGTFSNGGVALVRANDLWGAVDRHGRVVVPIRFKYLEPFGKNNVTAATLDGDYLNPTAMSHWGLVDRSGKFISAPIYQRIDEFDHPRSRGGPLAPPGLAAAYSINVDGEEITRYINRRGNVVLSLPPGLEGGQVDASGLVHVVDTSKSKMPTTLGNSGLVDLRHLDRPPLWFDELGRADTFNLMPVRLHGEWGYLDQTMRMAIPPRFASASSFGKDGLAAVGIEASGGEPKVAFIDRTGKVVLQTKYRSVSGFSPLGIATVSNLRLASVPLDYPADACRVIHPISGP